MNKVKVRWSERLIYIIACIVTLGFWYLIKLVIKIAIIESENIKRDIK